MFFKKLLHKLNVLAHCILPEGNEINSDEFRLILIRFYICEHTYAISMLTLPFPSCCSSCPTLLSPSGPASRVLLCCSHPRRPGSQYLRKWRGCGYNMQTTAINQWWSPQCKFGLFGMNHLCQDLLVKPIDLLEVLIGEGLVDLLWKTLGRLLECCLQSHFGFWKYHLTKNQQKFKNKRKKIGKFIKYHKNCESAPSGRPGMPGRHGMSSR